MSESDRNSLILDLDDELLKGSVVLSEWCAFVVREADTAFVRGAFLASILTAVSGIETYLRSEYSGTGENSLFKLIDQAPVEDDLKRDLHKLRKYRNKWVHIKNPADDRFILEFLERTEKDLESMAYFAARCLRRTIYENQGT